MKTIQNIKTKKLICCAILAILLALTVSTVSAQPVHNLDTGEDFATIQAAIDANNTTTGHVLSCDDQIYNESLLVYKELTIQSTNNTPQDCTIRSATNTTYAIYIMVNNINVKGFSIENGTQGVRNIWRSNITVDNCIFKNNTQYSYIASSSPYLEVTNCVFNDTEVIDQLQGQRCSYVYIANNTFNTPSGVDGIDFTSPRHAIFENNTCRGGTTAMYIKRPGTGFIVPLTPSSISTLKSSPVFEQNKVIVRNNDVRLAGYGIRSEGNSNNHDQYGDIYIHDNEVHKNGNNIYIRYLNNSYVYQNNVSGGGAAVYGIRFQQSNYTYVQNNTVNNPSESSQYGIHHDTCNYSYVQDNLIDRAMYGIFIRATDTFNVTKNTILNCTYRSIFITISETGIIYNNLVATDVSGLGTNCYEYGSPTVKFNITKTKEENIIGGPYIAGNYWSDYNGTDLNNDGIGDTYLPYDSEGKIQSGGGDYQPLVLPTTTKNINNVTIEKGQTWILLIWDMDPEKSTKVFHNGKLVTSTIDSNYLISDLSPNQKHTFALSVDTTPPVGYPISEKYLEFDQSTLMESFDQSLIYIFALSSVFLLLSFVYPLFSLIAIPTYLYGGITAINQSNESWIILAFFLCAVMILLLVPNMLENKKFSSLF